MICLNYSRLRSHHGNDLMRINVIGQANGVGLTRDMKLLAEALRQCGCYVDLTAIDSHQSKQRRSRIKQFGLQWRRARRSMGYSGTLPPHYDFNIMLEHIWSQHLESAHRNIVVPNPEWFDRHDVRFLPCVNRVWAKTHNTQQIFARLGCEVSQIGFDSEDRNDSTVPRERVFLHLAGKSTMKGTARLIQCWRMQPQWPTLVVVQHDDQVPNNLSVHSNIEMHTEYLDDAALKRLQNRCLFHLCTSETEGWGHYLVEAMSVGAITITLNAPPMNELVTVERGLLLAHKQTGRQKLADLYFFDEMALARVVQQTLTMSVEEVATLATQARRWFLKNKAGFSERIKLALGELHAQA